MYLTGTNDYGLLLSPRFLNKMVVYSNVGWASCLDTHRSTSSYCMFFGPKLISSSLKSQPTVSWSNAKVEYWVVANAVHEASCLHSLLSELGHKLLSVTLGFAIFLAYNPVQNMHTKHVEIDLDFMHEKWLPGLFEFFMLFHPFNLHISWPRIYQVSCSLNFTPIWTFSPFLFKLCVRAKGC